MTSAGQHEPTVDLTFVGTATVILRMGPFRLLTDPNFVGKGSLVYLGKGLFSRRKTDPALSIDEVPDLDAVVLSHLHGDHWDRIANKRMNRSWPVVTTPAAARTLERRGFTTDGLRSWQSHALSDAQFGLTITSVPGRHGRGALDAFLPPVMGTVLELKKQDHLIQRLYISGDTLLFGGLADVKERFGDFDAALLHLGGTRLLNLATVTMDAEQGTALAQLIDASTFVPIHYDDYGVFKSPLSDFVRKMHAQGLGDRLRDVKRGDTVSLPTRRVTE
ncbi:MAG: MBL fold metallo-hydrolase [Actinomycetes bacterium]